MFRQDLAANVPQGGKIVLGGDNWPLIYARGAIVMAERPDVTVVVLDGDDCVTYVPSRGPS